MSFVGDSLSQAWHLVVSGDPYLWGLVEVTAKLAAISTAIALVLGLPIGLALGVGRFRGRGVAQAIANIGVGLPPVFVGLVVSLLFFPRAPLGSLHLLFTLKGVYVAQTVLAFPVIVALTSSAVRGVTPGLFDQARGLGAGRLQLATLALREARVGIVAAVLVAIFSAMSEVGAVVLVGGNIEFLDQTLASGALQQVDAGNFRYGLAIGIVLLVLIIVVGTALTVLQRVGGEDVAWRRRV